MSKVNDQVLDTFYEQIADQPEVGEDVLAGLKSLLASGKVKADDLEAVLEGVGESALP